MSGRAVHCPTAGIVPGFVASCRAGDRAGQQLRRSSLALLSKLFGNHAISSARSASNSQSSNNRPATSVLHG